MGQAAHIFSSILLCRQGSKVDETIFVAPYEESLIMMLSASGIRVIVDSLSL
jgi:hypothetical protein